MNEYDIAIQKQCIGVVEEIVRDYEKRIRETRNMARVKELKRQLRTRQANLQRLYEQLAELEKG